MASESDGSDTETDLRGIPFFDQMASDSDGSDTKTEEQFTDGRDSADNYEGTYLRMRDAVDLTGGRYEYKMATLLFLRGLNQAAYFQLATNVKAAGKFDDILLRFRPTSDAQERLLLVQLKHKKNDDFQITRGILTKDKLRGKKNPFSLNEYFQSYCDMDAELRSQAYLVLFTNAAVQQRPSTCVRDIDDQVRAILNTAGRECCFCSFDLSADDDVCSTFDQDKLAEAKEFLSRFILCSHQASECHMDLLIRQELIRFYQRNVPEIDKAVNQLIDQVRTWWEPNDTDHSSFLTKSWSSWKQLDLSIQRTNPISMQIKFLMQEVEIFDHQIHDSFHTVINIEYDVSNEQVRTLKILQSFISRKEPFLLVSQTDSWETLEAALELWSDVLVVDVSAGDQRHDALCGRLCHRLLTDSNSSKRLILTSPSTKCEFVEFLSEELRFHWNAAFNTRWKNIKTTCKLKHFDDKSQDLILSKEFTFQGCELKFNALGQPNVLNVELNRQDISVFLDTENINIGKSLEVDLDVYLSRTIKIIVPIKPDVLKVSAVPDVFFVNGVTVEDMKSVTPKNEDVSLTYLHTDSINIRYFVRDNWKNIPSKDQFQYLAESVVDRPLHWLDNDAGLYKWRESRGDTRLLCQHLDAKPIHLESTLRQIVRSGTCLSQVEEVLLGEDRVVVVVGEPGMGKSVLLAHVANTAKHLFPSHWVVAVNLNDITDSLSDMASHGFTPEAVFSILSEAAHVAESTFPTLAEALLKDGLENTGNVVLLFDAFDEISPDYNGLVLQILKEVVNSKIRQIWITSRPVMQKELEETLLVQAHYIEEFSREQQVQFLAKFWGQRSSGKTAQAKLFKMAEELVKCIYRSIPLDHGKPLSSIPLHIMILGELYLQQALSEDVNGISRIVNLQEMYQKFIEEKQAIYYKVKMGINTTKSGMSKVLSSNRKKFMEDHMLCALITVLNNDELKHLHLKNVREMVEDIVDELSEGSERTGLLVKVVNGKPRFIHQTFAEYFVALWFVEHREKNRKILENIFFGKRFDVVRNMFNIILAKGCPLHLAVLNNAYKVVEEVVQKEVKSIDAAGRTALHLAAQRDSSFDTSCTVFKLLQNGASLEARDEIFDLTPIYYAAKVTDWSTVRFLLEKGARVDDNIGEEDLVQQVLKEAVQMGHIDERESVLYNRFDINWWILYGTEYGLMSIQHLAALCGHSECFRYLLTRTPMVTHLIGNDSTLLHCAAVGGSADIAQVILEHGEDVDVQDADGHTPLHLACLRNHGRVVRLLLNTGADVTLRTKEGKIALHEAVAGSDIDVVRTVLDNKCDLVNTKSSDGSTPLHLACRRGEFATVKVIVDGGGDCGIPDTSGDTGLEIAARGGHHEVVQYLKTLSSSNSNLNS